MIPLRLLLAIAAVALAGCLRSEPEIVLVTHELPPAAYPAECTDDDRDKEWIDPPDADLRRGAGARIWRANKERHNALLAVRRICRAAHVAHKTAGDRE